MRRRSSSLSVKLTRYPFKVDHSPHLTFPSFFLFPFFLSIPSPLSHPPFIQHSNTIHPLPQTFPHSHTLLLKVLSDPEKRRNYDQFGKEGLEGHGVGPTMDAADLFRNLFDGGFFGGFGGGGGSFADLFGGFGGGGGRRQRKGTSIKFPLSVTLKELYNGNTRKLKITRKVICGVCNGSGCKAGKAAGQCAGCGGRGVKVTVQRQGNCIMQQQTVCHACGGEGKAIAKDDVCGACAGERTIDEAHVLQVEIQPGMEIGDQILLEGEANELPDCDEAGDVIVQLQLKEDPSESHWRHIGKDLIYIYDLSLVEALCGGELYMTHLDGRILNVTLESDRVIQPGDLKKIEREGLPDRGNPNRRGDLFVRMNLRLPDKVTDAQKAAVEKHFPRSANAEPMEVTSVSAQHIDNPQHKKDGGSGGKKGGFYEKLFGFFGKD